MRVFGINFVHLWFPFRRDLAHQDARYAVQLEEAEKMAFDSQTKVNDLAYQISELERNLSLKIWNVERTYGVPNDQS